MRLIGDLESSQQALKFTAYLLVQGIESHVDQEGDKFEVWVKEEDRFPEALSGLKEFKLNPNAAKYNEAVPQAKAIVRSEVKKRQAIQKKVVRVNSQSMARRPPLTLICIGISILVALFTEFGAHDSFDGVVMQSLAFASVPRDEVEARLRQGEFTSRDDPRFRLMSISKGEIWRAITPIFIHFGLIHIAFNMYMFFQFGSLIERKYGAFKFGMLILLTAVISNLVQCLVPEAMGGSAPSTIAGIYITPLGGMSGVVYGLFGFFWMKSNYDPTFGYRIPQSTVMILLVWLVVCMLPINIGLGTGSVANWAHGIGLAVGMAIGYGTSMLK